MNDVCGVLIPFQRNLYFFFFLSRGVFNKQGYQCQGELISNDLGEIILNSYPTKSYIVLGSIFLMRIDDIKVSFLVIDSIGTPKNLNLLCSFPYSVHLCRSQTMSPGGGVSVPRSQTGYDRSLSSRGNGIT